MLFVLVFALIILSAFIHYQVLWRLSVMLPCLSIIPQRARVLFAILGALISHFIQICLFALTYYLLGRFSVTEFAGVAMEHSFTNFLYFSTETYTSLGLGDMFPLGEARLVVGVESIVGLLMISWSASFTFLEMQKNWIIPPASSDSNLTE